MNGHAPRGVRRAWRLSGLVARRCADSPRQLATWRWATVRRGVIRMAVLLEWAGGLQVADASGHACVSVGPPRLFDAPRLAAVVGAVTVVGGAVGFLVLAMWWPALVLVGAVWAVVVVPAGVVAWRCRDADRRLRQHRLADGWSVRAFAADPRHPGAGRALLASVCAEADAHGRVLNLETTAARLVDYYYCQVGFELVASEDLRAGPTRWTVFHMVRQPFPAPPS